jgi:protease I
MAQGKLSLPGIQKANMKNTLKGKKVAILVAEGFEQVELTEPREALTKAGALSDLISPKAGTVKAWDEDDFGDSFDVDVKLSEANAKDYDALLLPGGVMNPDTLRTIPEAVDFVREFFAEGKPVAAICHGPQMLIEAGVAKGRRLTSFPSLKTDLENAGAIWTDEVVVTDHGLVTSRKPADIPHFSEKMIEEFAEGFHVVQQKSTANSHA